MIHHFFMGTLGILAITFLKNGKRSKVVSYPVHAKKKLHCPHKNKSKINYLKPRKVWPPENGKFIKRHRNKWSVGGRGWTKNENERNNKSRGNIQRRAGLRQQAKLL